MEDLKANNLLIDTNVLVDVFLQRKPFEHFSSKIFQACMLKKCNGIIASHSFTNLFYLLRKTYSQKDLRKILLGLANYFEIASLDKRKVMSAIQRTDFFDFEDCLQDECAFEFDADYIITRNVKDFEKSKIQAVTPEEFIKMKSL